MKTLRKFLPLAFLLLFILSLEAVASEASFFPKTEELPGVTNHWIANILPVDESKGCPVYSATYAYFAPSAAPLLDIPRKKIYSVNVRVHVCKSLKAADALYTSFYRVGDKERKKLVGLGDKAFIYVDPHPKNPLMGDFYISVKLRYTVLQAHSDDGFVLMDMADIMTARVSEQLGLRQDALSSGLTLQITGDSGGSLIQMISFAAPENTKAVSLEGRVFDTASRPVKKASIRVQETGNTAVTDENGFFKLRVGDSKGKSFNIFRAFTLEGGEQKSDNTLTSGYYHVDIEYPSALRKDIWRLWVNGNTLYGTTLNLTDGKLLQVTGELKGDNIILSRSCGSGVLGQCKQEFKGERRQGVIEGLWTGSGGSGRWRLYPATGSVKTIRVSPEEADFTLAGTRDKKSGLWLVSAAKPLALWPSKGHEDFYFAYANLLLETVSPKSREARFELSGVTEFSYVPITTGPILEFSSAPLTSAIPITSAYLSPQYASYVVHTNLGEEVRVSPPAIEVAYGAPASRAKAEGRFKARLVSLDAEDYAGPAKKLKGNGVADIKIEVSGDLAGVALTEASARFKGQGGENRGERVWNTALDNIYPGIAVIEEGAARNGEDGSVYLPLEKFNNIFYLHMDRGNIKDYAGEFTVVLTVDGEKIPLEVSK